VEPVTYCRGDSLAIAYNGAVAIDAPSKIHPNGEGAEIVVRNNSPALPIDATQINSMPYLPYIGPDGDNGQFVALASFPGQIVNPWGDTGNTIINTGTGTGANGTETDTSGSGETGELRRGARHVPTPRRRQK